MEREVVKPEASVSGVCYELPVAVMDLSVRQSFSLDCLCFSVRCLKDLQDGTLSDHVFLTQIKKASVMGVSQRNEWRLCSAVSCCVFTPTADKLMETERSMLTITKLTISQEQLTANCQSNDYVTRYSRAIQLFPLLAKAVRMSWVSVPVMTSREWGREAMQGACMTPPWTLVVKTFQTPVLGHMDTVSGIHACSNSKS